MSCTICHKECSVINKNLEDDDEEESKKEDSKDAELHFICEAFGSLKKSVEDAIAEGTMNMCPGCKIAPGRKDDLCNHMRCNNCQTEWCYCCGRSLGARDHDHLFSEDDEWMEDQDKCPLYLGEFFYVDKTWPSNQSKALDEYHNQKILFLLKKAILSMKEEDRTNVWKYFPGSVNPYKLEDVVKFELREIFKKRWNKH